MGDFYTRNRVRREVREEAAVYETEHEPDLEEGADGLEERPPTGTERYDGG